MREEAEGNGAASTPSLFVDGLWIDRRFGTS